MLDFVPTVAAGALVLAEVGDVVETEPGFR